jgi:hypothetical protein
MSPRRAEGSAPGAPRARAEASLEQVSCGFCGHRFTAAEGRQHCAACSLLGTGGCTSLRCPRCGYENPEEPRWLSKLRGWLSGSKGKR